jgi:predicted lipid-binding transport protein (Tim44 family)
MSPGYATEAAPTPSPWGEYKEPRARRLTGLFTVVGSAFYAGLAGLVGASIGLQTAVRAGRARSRAVAKGGLLGALVGGVLGGLYGRFAGTLYAIAWQLRSERERRTASQPPDP